LRQSFLIVSPPRAIRALRSACGLPRPDGAAPSRGPPEGGGDNGVGGGAAFYNIQYYLLGILAH
jgi:hypothetical protein